MNKHLHRIIFNAARGQRMVVSEMASSHGGGAAGEAVGNTGNTSSRLQTVRRALSAIAFGIAALGASVLCTPVQAQIIADPRAPGNQRPTVLPGANNVPVVNIQTPSAAGVSRNAYRQFDVQSNGAILNNSRNNVQTQQGGWVGGNPWLSTGAARVILNEVNSSDPSRLNGYVEVAGQRAEVIIANPAGIQVNGGGFINAAGVTLTTGTAVMNNGSLDSFLVRGGQINVAGLGLDTSTADATRILARAVQVNAGIWAKDLTAVTGTNQVKALVSGSAASTTQIANPDPVAGAMPAFALDVAAIGGMYAGKIYMVGTEAGLGMNNQGTLAAQQGMLTLQANGQVVNTGRMQSQSALAIEAADSIHNTGHEAVISAQGQASLEAGKSITNTAGATMAAVGDLQAKAGGRLDNAAGTMAANGAVHITANGVGNQAGTIVSQQSAVDVQAGLAAVNNQQGTLAAAQHVNITSSALNNDQGLLQSGAHLAINTQGQTLTNTRSTGHGSGAGGLVAGGPITIATGSWNNDAGYAGADGNIAATATGRISSQQNGEIASTADIALTANEIDNQSGHVQASGNAGLTAADINNAAGQALANGNVTLTASHSINNAGGTLSAGQHLTVQDNAEDARSLAITNTAGLAEAGQRVTLRADSLSGDGKLQSAGDLLVDLQGDFESHTDVLAASNAKLVIGGTFTNQAKLQSGQAISVTATDIDNQATGEIAGHKRTALKAADSVSNRGLVDGAQTRIDAGKLTNIGTGRIYGDHVALAATTLLNDTETLNSERKDAVIAARERLDIGAATLINRENALIFSAGSGADALNIGGALDADGQAIGQAGLAHNASATIESLGGLSITADLLKNTNEHFSTTLDLVEGPERLKYIQPQGRTAKVLVENFVWQRWSKAGQYRFKGAPPINDSGVLGQSPIPQVGEETCVGAQANEVCTRQSGADYLSGNPAWAYFGIAPPTAPVPQPPGLTKPEAPNKADAASCEQGAGHDAQSCSAYSTVLAQYHLEKNEYDQAWDNYYAEYKVWEAHTDTLYEALDDKIAAYNRSFASSPIRAWTEYNVTRSEYETKVRTSSPGQILSGADMQLIGGDLFNDKSRIIAGSSLTGNLAEVANIEAMGEHVVHEEGTSKSTWSRWRGGVKRYHQRKWGGTVTYLPADEVQSLVLPVAEKLQQTQPVGSNLQLAAQNQAGTVHAPQSNGLSLSNGTALGGLPSNSLFRQNPGSGASYLIETDPRFADYRQWLGSDYMLKAMGSDPAKVQKRLGDGFYEQRLVREQVAQLTGRRFLDGHASGEAQYQALMDAGVTVAQTWGLVPGVSLSATQVAALTSDIVWLVNQEVTLADGSVQRVLTPQVYLRPRQGDLAPEGSLLAGQSVDLNLSGDLGNAGTIAGRNVVSINASTIDNIGGLIQASTVQAKAEQDIRQVGGRMAAHDALSVQAGRDLNITSTTQSGHNQAGASSFSRTAIDRVAGLYVSGDAGVLVASAGHDMDIVAGVINNAGKGNTVLHAGSDLRLGTVTSALQENNVRNASNYLTGGRSQEVGSQIHGGGNVVLVTGGDILARAANVQADKALAAQAGGSIAVQAGEASDNYSMGYVRKSGSTFNKRSSTVRNSAESTTAVASSFGGETIALQAEKNIAITASQVASDQGTTLAAKADVSIAAGTDSSIQSNFRKDKKSGIFPGSGIGINIGKQQQSTDQAGRQTTAAAATVGAVSGDVNIAAGNQYRQTGSDVVTPQGDVHVLAQDIAITEARATSGSSTETRFKQSGINVSISSPIISAVQTADSMAKAASNTSSGRMQALAAGATALNVYNMRKDLQGAADALASGDISKAFSVSVSVGTSKSHSTSTQSSESTRGSTVLAGNNVNLQAQGAGEGSDILLGGSDISAGKDVALKAEGDILLQAAQNLASQGGKNSSSSGSIGISVGGQTGITLSASKGRGNQAGDDLVHANTHITAGNAVSLQSGADTTLQGAVVKGETVKAQVGGNLHIESLQDSSTYASRNQSIGGSITVSPAGVPMGGSFNAGKSKIDSDYLSVVEQSGIKAGDGGFDVKVKGDTDLKGAVIASNQVAVDQGKNHFSTEGELTTSDLQNSAKYEGKAVGVSASVGNDNGKFGVSGVGAGVGQDSGSASSTTTAGISGIAGDQSVRSTDAETGIQRIFDKEKVQKEIDAQVAITAEFGKQASKAWGDYANEQFAKAVAATDEEGARCWGPDGACRAGGHALVGGLGGGVAGAAGAGLSSVMAPQVQQALVNSGIAPNAAQAITQLTVIGSGAAMGGASGAAGAANEVNNNFVVAVPVIVEGVIAGGALAARACLSSPACVRALQLGGAALVAKVAAVLTPDEVAGIPGFGAGELPKPTGPLVNIPVETGPKDGLLVNVPQGIDTSLPGYESKKPIETDGGTVTLNPKPQLDLIMLAVPAGDKENLNNGLKNIMGGMPVLETGNKSSNDISRYEQGTFEDATKVFNQLGLINIRDLMTTAGPGKEGSLPDGTRVIIRPSSSDGAPTMQIIDVNRPKPRTVQEIRFGQGKK